MFPEGRVIGKCSQLLFTVVRLLFYYQQTLRRWVYAIAQISSRILIIAEASGLSRSRATQMLPEGLECNMDKKKEGFQHGKTPRGRWPRLYQEPAGRDVMDYDEHAP